VLRGTCDAQTLAKAHTRAKADIKTVTRHGLMILNTGLIPGLLTRIFTRIISPGVTRGVIHTGRQIMRLCKTPAPWSTEPTRRARLRTSIDFRLFSSLQWLVTCKSAAKGGGSPNPGRSRLCVTQPHLRYPLTVFVHNSAFSHTRSAWAH
jgi:hypothetical protein